MLLSDIVPVVAVLLTLVGGFVTWGLTERSRRIQEEYRRKEERYTELVSRLRAFTVAGSSTEKRNEFLDQLNLAWLYCSDEVIHSAYAFLDTVHVEAPEVGEAHERRKREALGRLMLAIRRDLIARRPTRTTALTPGEFRVLGAR